jgi:hypothetical protein
VHEDLRATESPQDAAGGIFTGRMTGEYGFNNVDVVADSIDKVVVYQVMDENAVAALRAVGQHRSPADTARLLETLVPGGLTQSTTIFYLKRAFPEIPLKTIIDGKCGKMSAGGQSLTSSSTRCCAPGGRLRGRTSPRLDGVGCRPRRDCPTALARKT